MYAFLGPIFAANRRVNQTDGGSATDPYWDNVVLLMSFDGANGSTTFIDSAKPARQFTSGAPAGNLPGPVISTQQSRFGGASVGFLNTNAYLAAPNSVDFQFRTADFTIEFWLYNNIPWVDQFNQGIVGQKANDYSSGWQIYRNTAYYTDRIAARIGGTNDFFSATTPAVGVWEHWALTREGETLRWFRNGVLDNTGFIQHDVNDTGDEFRIGAPQTWGGIMDAYIDEMRITKGIARYTDTFTPPTAAFPKRGVTPTDPYWNDVLLYLPMNGSDGSTTFTDVSSSTRPVTVSGNARISTVQSKYGSAAGFFDGGADYLTVNALTLDAADFTIECWVCPNEITQAAILNQGDADVSGNWCLAVFPPGSVVFYADNFPRLASTLTMAVGQWQHIALTRSGNTYRLFVDGAIQDTQNYSFNHTGAPFKVGNGYGGISTFVGYIDEVRVTKGVARYTANFTPPTQAFPTTGGSDVQTDPYWNSVELFLPFNGVTDSQDFIDVSSRQVPVVANGDVRLSGPREIGGRSARWPWNGSNAKSQDVFLRAGPLASDYLAGDFTIEGWVWIEGNTDHTFFSAEPYFCLTVILCAPGGRTQVFVGHGVNGAWVDSAESTGVLEYGTWHHVALVRAGSLITLYHDGVHQLSLSTPVLNFNPYVRIGDAGPYYTTMALGLSGFVDDFRITKAARYLSDFTPPTPI